MAINSNTLNLNFTMTYSETANTFLDVAITKNDDGGLASGLYHKPCLECTSPAIGGIYSIQSVPKG